VTSCEFGEKRATKPQFVAQSRTALYVLQQLSNPHQMFLLREEKDHSYSALSHVMTYVQMSPPSPHLSSTLCYRRGRG